MRGLSRDAAGADRGTKRKRLPDTKAERNGCRNTFFSCILEKAVISLSSTGFCLRMCVLKNSVSLILRFFDWAVSVT